MVNVDRFVFALVDARLMAFLWIAAYGIVLVYVRRLLLVLETGRTRQRAFSAACGAVILFLGWLSFGGQSLVFRWLGIGGVGDIPFMSLVWGFICTLWAVLDGVFVLYAMRLWSLLWSLLAHRQADVGRWLFAYRRWLIGIWAGVMFGFYGIYFTHALVVFQKYRLDLGDLLTISFFFVRICGVFWVVFEGMLAVLMYQIYRLLVRAQA